MHTSGSFYAEDSDSRCAYRSLAVAVGVLLTFLATTGPLAPLRVLGPRGVPLEKIAARICREAGARVTTDTFLRDLNVDSLRRGDRRLEVIANGLPLFHGAQIAVDTTLVSPTKRNGKTPAAHGHYPRHVAGRGPETKEQYLPGARQRQALPVGGPCGRGGGEME